MKIQLSDLFNYDGKEVIWVLGKTMTVVRLQIPEDQKKEIVPIFVVQKGLEGGLMKWEPGVNFYPLESADEAYELWKKNMGMKGEEEEEETPEKDDQRDEFNII